MTTLSRLAGVIAVLIFIGAGCAGAPVATPAPVINFAEPVTLNVGHSAHFSNGVIATLKQINDSRCRPNVQCVWAGELSPVFTLTGDHSPENPFNDSPAELTLGTARTPAAQVSNGDWLILKDASVDTATVVMVPGQGQSPSRTNDKVHLAAPLAGAIIKTPLVVTGEAVGPWYFEASFPVRLLDANGKELAQTPAQAQSDWMVNAFVPFTATLNFTTPTTDTGTLMLVKDNPSGLSEHDDYRSIPVRFR